VIKLDFDLDPFVEKWFPSACFSLKVLALRVHIDCITARYCTV